MKTTLVMQRIFLWGVACSLPAIARTEWLEKWNSEIWYVHNEGATQSDTWRFTLGSLNDAAFTRREIPDESHYLVHSPRTCLLVMVLLNLAMVSVGLLLPLSRYILAAAVHAHHQLQPGGRETSTLLEQVTLIAYTFMISLVITAIRLATQLSRADERITSTLRARTKAFSFFLAKLLLGIPLVYFAALCLSCMVVRTEEMPLLQVYASLAGYIIFLQWTHTDQQRRCPACLKRLGNPVRLGRPSWALLDWNMQEYICPDGHGVMQIPAAPLTGQPSQEWVALT